MIRYAVPKLCMVIPSCFLAFTIDQMNILYGIVFIVLLDTILGVWCSIKFRRFESHKLRRMVAKVGQYSLALASVWILTAIDQQIFGWVFRGVGIFIIMTELLSNFEKLALLGMKLPVSLVSKINKEYLKLIKDPSHAEYIIDKRDCEKS